MGAFHRYNFPLSISQFRQCCHQLYQVEKGCINSLHYIFELDFFNRRGRRGRGGREERKIEIIGFFLTLLSSFIFELDFFYRRGRRGRREREERKIEIIGFSLILQSAQADFVCVDAVSTADFSFV
jgi:hypothetical protein